MVCLHLQRACGVGDSARFDTVAWCGPPGGRNGPSEANTDIFDLHLDHARISYLHHPFFAMNDVLATVLALGLIYLVLKFAFGGPSSSNTATGARRDPIPLHEQQQHLNQQQQQTGGLAAGTSSATTKKETLISRYNLEARISQQQEREDAADAAAAIAPLSSKGKGKAQTDEEWKKGADKRRDDLRKRREDMILDARR